MQGRCDVGQQLGRGEALGEDAVAAREDGGAYDAVVGGYEAVEAAVHETEAKDIVGREMRKALEEKLCGQLGEVDNGVTLLVACCFFPLLALGALVVEGQSRRLVFEGLIVVANVSRHRVRIAVAPQSLTADTTVDRKTQLPP